ncbi:MAG: outer membrane lipoprotein-sorting protein [Bacteroidota bacterium]
MNRVFLSCALLLAFMFVRAQGRPELSNGDEIVNAYLEAIGGVENWQSLTSTRMEVSISQMGMEMPGVITQAPPNKQRIEINTMGKLVVQVYDGETAWMINPSMGAAEAQLMPAEMAERFSRQSYENDFINFAEKGYSIDYLGQKYVEGVSCYELKMTDEDGIVSFSYFDSQTSLLIMQKTYVTDGPQAGQEVKTYFSEFEEISGLWIPTFTESKTADTTQFSIRINKVEYNLEISDNTFTFPED